LHGLFLLARTEALSEAYEIEFDERYVWD